MSVYELQDLLREDRLKDKVDESREFATPRADRRCTHLSAQTTTRSRKDRGVKKAPFVVLIGASMPSVLAEIGFISNAHDESVMRREEYRQRMAEALYKGIIELREFVEPFSGAQQRRH